MFVEIKIIFVIIRIPMTGAEIRCQGQQDGFNVQNTVQVAIDLGGRRLRQSPNHQGKTRIVIPCRIRH